MIFSEHIRINELFEAPCSGGTASYPGFLQCAASCKAGRKIAADFPYPCHLALPSTSIHMSVYPTYLQVKNHEYCKRANSIVDGLPPEEIPRVRMPMPNLCVYSRSSHKHLV